MHTYFSLAYVRQQPSAHADAAGVAIIPTRRACLVSLVGSVRRIVSHGTLIRSAAAKPRYLDALLAYIAPQALTNPA